MEDDPQVIRPYILIFKKRLEERDPNAFSWVYFFMVESVDVIITKRKKFINNNRSTTGKVDILLWKVLAHFLNKEVHDTLVEAYYNHTENRPCLQLAILTALSDINYVKLDISEEVSGWETNELVNKMLNGEFKLEVDDYCIDKHTRKGRSLGKDVNDFIRDGTIVIPQDMNYYNELLSEIYEIRD